MLWELLVLQIGFFILLIWAMKRLFHGQILHAIRRMDRLQQQNLKKEEELKSHERQVAKECEDKIKNAEAALGIRRREVEDEIKNTMEKSRQKIEEEKAAILAQARETEKTLKKRFEREAEKKGGQIALKVIRSAFNENMLEGVHEELCRELIDSMPELKKQGVALGQEAVGVRSAFALSSPIRERLKKGLALLKTDGSGIAEIHEEIDKELMAGFVIKCERMVLDGSLKNRFEKQINAG